MAGISVLTMNVASGKAQFAYCMRFADFHSPRSGYRMNAADGQGKVAMHRMTSSIAREACPSPSLDRKMKSR